MPKLIRGSAGGYRGASGDHAIADVAIRGNLKPGGDRVDIVIEEMEEVTPKHPGGCGAVYWAGGTTAVCI